MNNLIIISNPEKVNKLLVDNFTETLLNASPRCEYLYHNTLTHENMYILDKYGRYMTRLRPTEEFFGSDQFEIPGECVEQALNRIYNKGGIQEIERLGYLVSVVTRIEYLENGSEHPRITIILYKVSKKEFDMAQYIKKGKGPIRELVSYLIEGLRHQENISEIALKYFTSK